MVPVTEAGVRRQHRENRPRPSQAVRVPLALLDLRVAATTVDSATGHPRVAPTRAPMCNRTILSWAVLPVAGHSPMTRKRSEHLAPCPRVEINPTCAGGLRMHRPPTRGRTTPIRPERVRSAARAAITITTRECITTKACRRMVRTAMVAMVAANPSSAMCPRDATPVSRARRSSRNKAAQASPRTSKSDFRAGAAPSLHLPRRFR